MKLQPTRIRTRFGVTLPPWRLKKRGKPVVLDFILSGYLPSLKNKQRASFNHRWVNGQVKNFERSTGGNPTGEQAISFVKELVGKIRPFIYKPPDVKSWEKKTIEVLTTQAATHAERHRGKGLQFPLIEFEIKVKYYWADEHGRDTIGKDESVYDILVRAGIIIDDDYRNLFRDNSEADCFKGEIVDSIAEIYVCAYKW